MTTQAMAIGGQAVRSQSRLEELVDRVIEALFGVEEEEVQVPAPTVVQSIHEARRLRRAGDLEGALAVMSKVDTPNAPVKEACWAYSEWKDLVRRRFGKKGALIYSPGAGRAAALVGRDGSTLEVVAVQRMKWLSGKVVSKGSLQGLGEWGRVMVLAPFPKHPCWTESSAWCKD